MPELGSQFGKVSGAGQIIKKSDLSDADRAAVEAIKEASVPAPEGAVEPRDDEVPEPKISDKPGFNPNTVQDARVSKEEEGGISKSETTGITGMSESIKTGILLPYKGDLKDKYELTGFTASYTVPGTNDIQSQEIRIYYDKLDVAKESINGSVYTHILDGEKLECKITRGMPCISINDVMKCEYIDGEWRRS